MEKIFYNKRVITTLGTIIALVVLFLITGCNKQVFDTEYTFNKAYCNYDGDKFELGIRKWKDYEGEQVQIIDNTGKTYLISTNKCYLTN